MLMAGPASSGVGSGPSDSGGPDASRIPVPERQGTDRLDVVVDTVPPPRPPRVPNVNGQPQEHHPNVPPLDGLNGSALNELNKARIKQLQLTKSELLTSWQIFFLLLIFVMSFTAGSLDTKLNCAKAWIPMSTWGALGLGLLAWTSLCHRRIIAMLKELQNDGIDPKWKKLVKADIKPFDKEPALYVTIVFVMAAIGFQCFQIYWMLCRHVPECSPQVCTGAPA